MYTPRDLYVLENLFEGNLLKLHGQQYTSDANLPTFWNSLCHNEPLKQRMF